MTTSKEAATLLLKNWHALTKELKLIEESILKNKYRKQEIIGQLEGLLKTFDILKERPDNLEIPYELLYSPDATISDVITKLLIEHGAMTRKELTDILLKMKRLKPDNARIVLANTVMRGLGKIFKEVDGGKIGLI